MNTRTRHKIHTRTRTQGTLQTLLLLTIMVLLSCTSRLQAAVESPEGISWYLGKGDPDTYVSVSNSKINVQAWSNIPPIELQTINSLLWSEYQQDYIQIKDFNKDGYLDVAIMKGAGYGGDDICYAVYEYVPIVYSYSNKVSTTICNQ